MPAEKIKLLPCPFCGSEAGIYGGDGANYYAACKNKFCFCSLGEQYYPGDIPAHIFGDRESAAYNWNRRAKLVEGLPQADNTGSPKLPPCSGCDVPNELAYYQSHGYKYCPRCGQQLRAGA